LAANQCGIPHSVFVMGGEGVGYALFNPQIVDFDGEAKIDEGCLSFPGLYLPIKRAENVKVKYQDMNGEEKTQTFGGVTARVILHEYDHLQGKIFTDLVPRIILDRSKAKVKKNLKLLAKQRHEYEKRLIIQKAAEKVALKMKMDAANNPNYNSEYKAVEQFIPNKEVIDSANNINADQGFTYQA